MTQRATPFPPDPERCTRTEAWFAALRDRICAAFEAIEDEFAADGPGAAKAPMRAAAASRRAGSSAPRGSGRVAAAGRSR